MHVLSILIVGMLFAHTGQANTATQKRGDPQNNPPRSSSTAIKECLDCFNVQTPHAETEQKDPYDASKDSLYRKYLLFTVIGVCGGLVGLVFLIVQTIATRNAANAAKNSADALVKSQCAWIMVDIKNVAHVPIEHSADGKTKADVIFICKNLGQTPAWLAEFRYTSEIVSVIPSSQDFEAIPVCDGFEVEPVKAGGESYDFAQKLSCSTKQGTLIIYGMVKYRDMFGNSNRYTTFGFWITTVTTPAQAIRINLDAYNQNT